MLSKIEGNVAIFSSGHISRVIAARFLGWQVSYGKYLSLSPASISVLGFEHDEPVIQLWNYTSAF